MQEDARKTLQINEPLAFVGLTVNGATRLQKCSL